MFVWYYTPHMKEETSATAHIKKRQSHAKDQPSGWALCGLQLNAVIIVLMENNN